MDQEKRLIKLEAEQRHNSEKLDRHHSALFGNGQKGLVHRVVSVESRLAILITLGVAQLGALIALAFKAF